jgi:hypothetical protein
MERSRLWHRIVNRYLLCISATWIPYTIRFANEVVLPYVEEHWYHDV